MKKLRLKNALSARKGMTLVELLVALLLIVLVMTVISTFFAFIARFYRNTDDLAAKQDQARLIVLGLRNSLDTSLDLSIAASAPSGALPSGYCAYYVSNGRLTRRLPDGTVEYVFSNVSFDSLELVFTLVSPTILSIEVLIAGESLAQTEILLENCTISSGAAGVAVLYLPVS